MLMQQQLRSLINQHGLYAVLDAMSSICNKHAGIAGNCTAVDDWMAAKSAIDAAASKVLDLFDSDKE